MRADTLMYLDDIELYAGTDDHVRSLLRTVDIFSRDIRISIDWMDSTKPFINVIKSNSIGDLQNQVMTDTGLYKYLEI